MKMKLITIWAFVFLFLAGSVAANTPVTDKIKLELLDRNFPMMRRLLAVSHAPKDLVFIAIRARIERDAGTALNECRNAACFSQAIQFTDQEIKNAGDELVKGTNSSREWKTLLKQLKRDNQYQLFAADPDTAFIRNIWEQEAKGVNYILATYVEGRLPIYPKIDAISYSPDDTTFRNEISTSIKEKRIKKRSAFCALPVLIAIDALWLNERDEAVRYWPLTKKENAAAYRHTSTIRWEKYPYSVILVPGLGPEQPGVKLDTNGAKRCDSAVLRWRAGLAPFLVVSGGHVHPNKTPYCEAVEMKKYLMEVLKVPESAIIIEPHARHTTTNLRNTNRLIHWFRIPFEKQVLIVTDSGQNKYINGNMKGKVKKELGYLPFASIKMLSSTESEYLPSLNAMHINPFDPLDP